MISFCRFLCRFLYSRGAGLQSNHQGAVLVEFAIAAGIIIAINILSFDVASYFRLSQQVKHPAQFIQTNLANDTDHNVTLDDLENQIQYLNSVTGISDFNVAGTLIVMDAIPVYSNTSSQWSLLVCWSWSSNPQFKAAPKPGTFLNDKAYRVDLWTPASGVSASSALVIVEAHQTNIKLLDVSLVPEISERNYHGPIRYLANRPLNLMLYTIRGGKNLNNITVREPSPSNAIACQR